MYTVDVTNSGGTVTSAPVAVVVSLIKPSNVAISPNPASVNTGKAITLTVTAQGSLPFLYQWQRGGSSVGTNSATYAITARDRSGRGYIHGDYNKRVGVGPVRSGYAVGNGYEHQAFECRYYSQPGCGKRRSGSYPYGQRRRNPALYLPMAEKRRDRGHKFLHMPLRLSRLPTRAPIW